MAVNGSTVCHSHEPFAADARDRGRGRPDVEIPRGIFAPHLLELALQGGDARFQFALVFLKAPDLAAYADGARACSSSVLTAALRSDAGLVMPSRRTVSFK